MEEKRKEMTAPAPAPETEPLKKSVFSVFIWEVAFAQGLASITAGMFFTGYLCYLGASNKEIGWITSIPLFANLAAPFFSYFIDRAEDRKKLYFKALLPGRLLWFAVAAVPVLFHYKLISAPLLVFSSCYLVMSLFSTHSVITWTSWMGDLIPWDRRGHYFGLRTNIANISSIIIYLMAGWYIDKWKPINESVGFSSLFFAAAVFGLIAYFIQKRLPEVPRSAKPDNQASAFDITGKLLEIMKNKNFMRLALFNTTWAFIIGLTAVYQTVFLIRVVKIEYKYLTLFVILEALVRVLITKFWGKMMDKHGYKPIMLICGRFIGLIPFFFVFVGWSIWMLIPLYLISGTFWPGVGVAQFNIMFRLTPKKDRAAYLAFNTILTSSVAFIGPVVGGYLLDWMGNFSFKVLFLNIGAFQLLFLAGAMMRSLPLFILSKVEENKEAPVDEVMIEVRSTIAAGFLEGLLTLRDYMLIPVKKAGDIIENIYKNTQ